MEVMEAADGDGGGGGAHALAERGVVREAPLGRKGVALEPALGAVLAGVGAKTNKAVLGPPAGAAGRESG